MGIVVDFSTLAATSQCSTQAGLRYALGYTTRDEHAALRAGSAAHAALAVFLKGESATRAAGKFTDEYEAYAETIPATDRLAYPNLHAIMLDWFERNPLLKLPFAVEKVEVQFRIPLADGIIYTGVCDGLGYSKQNGRPVVIEHKTTGRITSYWLRKWQQHAQLTGYYFAAIAEFGRDQPIGVYVNAIEFSQLPTSTRTCREHATTYDECGTLHAKHGLYFYGRGPEQVEEFKTNAISLAVTFAHISQLLAGDPQNVQFLPQQGRFNGHCQFCQFVDFCDAGRPVHRIESMLVRSPWKPIQDVS